MDPFKTRVCNEVEIGLLGTVKVFRSEICRCCSDGILLMMLKRLSGDLNVKFRSRYKRFLKFRKDV
jgi:hypothetical protein